MEERMCAAAVSKFWLNLTEIGCEILPMSPKGKQTHPAVNSQWL